MDMVVRAALLTEVEYEGARVFPRRESQRGVEVGHHLILSGLAVEAAQRAEASGLTEAHEGVEHGVLHASPEHPATHKPEPEVEGLARDLAGQDRDQAVVAESVAQ